MRLRNELTCVNTRLRKAYDTLAVKLQAEVDGLLGVLLGRLRGARETPLQFGIDSEGIVSATLKDRRVADMQFDSCANGSFVTTRLDELITELLQPQRGSGRKNEVPMHSALSASLAMPGQLATPTMRVTSSHPLVHWLERVHTVLSNAQPRVVEIIAMRLEGFGDRDIAERLGMGLRLLRRIVADAQADWQRESDGALTRE